MLISGLLKALLLNNLLLFKLSKGVTVSDPCDPVSANVSVRDIYSISSSHILKFINSSLWISKSLKHVNCSSRGLNQVPQTLSRDTEFIDLSYNVIRRFGVNTFARHTQAVVIDLSYNCVRNHEELPSCNENTIIQRGTFSNLTNLKMLILRGNNMTSFPPCLSSSLEWLDMSMTFVPPIRHYDISHMANLSVMIASVNCHPFVQGYCPGNFSISDHVIGNSTRVLMLSLDNLQRVPKFSYTENLQYLDLHANSLRILEVGVFEQTPGIEYLFLSMANGFSMLKGQTLKLKPGALDPLLDLVHLDLSSNLIEFIPKNFFYFNRRLQVLDLSMNCLWRYVENPEFVPLENLIYLDVSNAVTCEYKVHNVTRNFLYLGEIYAQMHKLKFLFIGERRSFVPSSDNHLVFKHISNETFRHVQNLTHLRHVSLASCGIETISPAPLFSMKALSYLDISWNSLINEQERKIVKRNPSTIQQERRFTSWLSWDSRHIWKEVARIDMAQQSMAERLQVKASGCLEYVPYFLDHNRLLSISAHLLNALPATSHLYLSNNGIKEVKRVFDELKCLHLLDLRYNPIISIQANAFSSVTSLRYLYLWGSAIIVSYDFLFNLASPISLTFVSPQSLFFSILFPSTIPLIHVYEVDFSYNPFPVSVQYELTLLFKHLPRVNKATLTHCMLKLPSISLNSFRLKELNIGHNLLLRFPHKLLNSLPNLEKFVISFNLLTSLNGSILCLGPNLRYLDISHNHISFIAPRAFDCTSKHQLQYLDLSNNYITNVHPSVFGKPLLSNLQFFDIRWNMIECDCSLMRNFGTWLDKRNFVLGRIPGVLPECSESGSNYVGGCVSCLNAGFSNRRSLLKYSLTAHCNFSLDKGLCFGFFALVALFLSATLISRSAQWKRMVYTAATRHVKPNKERNISRQEHAAPGFYRSNKVFAYHVFVLFDHGCPAVGNWVDNDLEPWLKRLSSRLVVGLNGRDDYCCLAPGKQVLLQIEASKAVIIIISEGYSSSMEGKYVLSVMEYLLYGYGRDHCIFVVFDKASKRSDLIQRRFKLNPTSVVLLPESENNREQFWSALKESLQSSICGFT